MSHSLCGHRTRRAGAVVVSHMIAATVLLAQDAKPKTALNVKAGGEKTFYVD